ncbi:Glycine-rich cell wall structural protein-like [Pseudomonas chlororaphis]
MLCPLPLTGMYICPSSGGHFTQSFFCRLQSRSASWVRSRVLAGASVLGKASGLGNGIGCGMGLGGGSGRGTTSGGGGGTGDGRGGGIGNRVGAGMGISKGSLGPVRGNGRRNPPVMGGASCATAPLMKLVIQASLS